MRSLPRPLRPRWGRPGAVVPCAGALRALCAGLKRYAARSAQAAGALARAAAPPLDANRGACPAPALAAWRLLLGGWLGGCAAAPLRFCAPRFARRPKTGVAPAPAAAARGSARAPLLGCGQPCGGGLPLPAAGARVALTPATFCRRPSRARRLMGSRGSSCPGSRVLFGFFPAAASPRFSPRVGQGTQGAPRGRGVPPAAAGGGRPPHAVGRKGVLLPENHV